MHTLHTLYIFYRAGQVGGGGRWEGGFLSHVKDIVLSFSDFYNIHMHPVCNHPILWIFSLQNNGGNGGMGKQGKRGEQDFFITNYGQLKPVYTSHQVK